MSKSKAHLLAEKFSGKEIGEKQFTDVLDTIAVMGRISKFLIYSMKKTSCLRQC